MLLKILLLLLMISLSAMGMDMRDTDEILKRMHAKSAKVGKEKNTQVRSTRNVKSKQDTKTKTKNITKDELVENKKKLESDNELVWENNSKKYITLKKYNIALREFVELKYPKEVTKYKEEFKKQKAQKAKKRAQKAKQRAQKQKEVRAKAKIKREKAKLQKEKARAKKEKQFAAEEKTQKAKMAQIEARVVDEKVVKAKREEPKVDKQKKAKVSSKKKSLKMKRDGAFVVGSDKLMWQDNEEVKSTNFSWTEAMGYCEDLTLGSYDDWRIPTKEELDGILDKKNKPTINKKFQNVKATSYWSKSDYKNSKYYAWVLYFDSGAFGSYSKKKDSLVRCVRDVK